MPGTVIGKSLNLGFIGKVSRNPNNKIRARFVKSILNGSGVETLSVIPFGSATVLNVDNTYSKFGDSGTGVTSPAAAAFAGIAVAEVKQSMTYAYGENNTAGSYAPKTACDVLQIGTTTVYCTSGTPTAGGAVYIVTANVSASVSVGDFVASSSISGATVVELPNCKWATGKTDDSADTNVYEVEILYQVTA